MQRLNLPVSSLDWIFIAEFETLQNKGLYNGKADTSLTSGMKTTASDFPLLLEKLQMASSKIKIKKR